LDFVLTTIAAAYRFKSNSAFPFDNRLGQFSVPLRPSSGGGPTEETTNMFDCITGDRCFGRHLVLAGITAGSTLIGVSAAIAGSCPSDKMKADARQPVTQAGKGVTDTVLAAIDLQKEPANIKDRQLRFRKLTIEPGGIVPWHSHGDRPAIIYIAEGEIIEYASNCSVPIVHKAGEVRPETSGTSHWWQNTGSKTVILFVGDVLHDKTDHNM
jgi:quercetin dioxygenase-like cupin family protein